MPYQQCAVSELVFLAKLSMGAHTIPSRGRSKHQLKSSRRAHRKHQAISVQCRGHIESRPDSSEDHVRWNS